MQTTTTKLCAIVADRFQELDLSISAFIGGSSLQEDKWMDKVTAALCQRNNYRLVRMFTGLLGGSVVSFTAHGSRGQGFDAHSRCAPVAQ